MKDTADCTAALVDDKGEPLVDADRMLRTVVSDSAGGGAARDQIIAFEKRKAEAAVLKDAVHSPVCEDDVWFKVGVVRGLAIALSVRQEAAKELKNRQG